MRVTSSMYYDNMYGTENSKLQNNLFDVNKQIASGLSIQYASDDVSIFAETMQLDNEMTTLGQIKKSTDSGYKYSNQTDVVLNEFDDTIDRFKSLLVDAANGTHSDESLDAIADELRVMEDHLKDLSNTSINGQYLFSGNAVGTKPISSDGTYNGNDGKLYSFTGSGTKQQYNLSGDDLFLGEESLVKREVTTNIMLTNLNDKYDFETGDDNGNQPKPITGDNTIRDLMGDTDDEVDTKNKRNHFYLSGVKSDGTSFNKQISLTDDSSVDSLLDGIGQAYGNTPDLKLVNVSLNDYGQIVVEDKVAGSSKLDFHMIGATDFDQDDGNDDADVTNINDLDSGESDFGHIMSGDSKAENSNLYVKEFVKSSYDSSVDAPKNIDGLLYDNTQFTKDGSKITSSMPQIARDGNEFATPSTKISSVADISKGTDDRSDDTLDGNKLRLVGKDINGDDYDAQINFSKDGSTFDLDTNGDGNYDTSYDIYNVGSPREAVKADDMTYQQLMDVMNMVVTNNLPAGDAAEDYDNAIENSNTTGNTHLTYDSKIEFGDISTANTDAEIALYDVKSGDFSSSQGSVLSFNANNSLTISDAKTDFFSEIDEMITAVEDHKTYPDGSSGDLRNVGIEHSIKKLDDLQLHLSRSHSVVGAQSNALTMSNERTSLLEINTMSLRSSVVDTDLAEASLNLTKLNQNYEAMLSTVGKVSKLSLVNYL